MSSSSSRSRRRKVAEEEVEAPQPPAVNGKEEIGKVAAAVKVNPKKLYSFNPTYAEFPEKLVVVPKATKKDINLWEKLTEDAQDVCVRRILRLFLTKGAKRELIKKDTITKVLKDIDPTYGAVANSVLKVVKEELKDNFGYSLTCRADPTIAKESNEFVLFNALHGPHLQDLLADGSSVQKSAWMGFVFVVLQCVNSSAGKTIDFQTLLTRIREIDNRFPDTALKKAATNSSGAVPVPELGADFPSLMKRMVNERYVTVVAETGSAVIKETKEDNKTRYTFGQRFYAELGRRQLLTSYYDTVGTVIDKGMFKDVAEEEAESFARVADRDADAEEEDGGEEEEEEGGPAKVSGRKKQRKG